ncbi:d-Tyr-tRNA(Tyr) deacylase domain-containing protein [Phthorimaea operculella]|nr:d-Tyr-tRNA(Tyr) deacylase domain-containing protein [Phthorimaea operculella]
MKALIQRVMNAKVTVKDQVISNIGQGLCVFIGISDTDTIKDMEYVARKILSVRLFEDDDEKKWNKSVVDKQYEILCVSQFTLIHSWKGNKPDFRHAMPGDKSQLFYKQLIDLLKTEYNPDKIKDGLFGAYMQVSIQNDGPVTVEIESPAYFAGKGSKGRGRAPDEEASGETRTSRHGEEETKV